MFVNTYIHTYVLIRVLIIVLYTRVWHSIMHRSKLPWSSTFMIFMNYTTITKISITINALQHS